MPELPEVETVRRGLAPVLEGRRLAEVVQRRPDLRWPLPERFAERLTGRRVAHLGRRSKYLLAALDGDETWIVHLGMSGRMIVHPVKARAEVPGAFALGPPGAGLHDHVSVETDRGDRVVYNDVRRFGAMDLWPTDRIEEHWLLARLGPEPLSNAFSGETLAAAFRTRQSPVKAALLDQRVVAGLGNIYVCEALHRAGIHPRRIAATLSRGRIERLVVAIRQTLEAAIAAGGSSLRDYRQADGELGYFQHTFRVYGRADQPCPCGRPGARILRIVQQGRSSFYCSRCQR
ncbi:MAG: bifunctional DNA-formamidopyrimidine glycosylase/DNA-(apurinic or apyrimidinic site) lyase [Paracoccaceae bacterium]